MTTNANEMVNQQHEEPSTDSNHKKRPRLNRYVLASAVLASMNSVLLGYGKRENFTLSCCFFFFGKRSLYHITIYVAIWIYHSNRNLIERLFFLSIEISNESPLLRRSNYCNADWAFFFF